MLSPLYKTDKCYTTKRGQTLKGFWLCRCDCGNYKEIYGPNIFRGNSKSCGCKQYRPPIHGMAASGSDRRPEYAAWAAMKTRCKPDYRKKESYFDRGITVCEAWAKPDGFIDFYNHIGPRPSDRHSVDRIDNNLGYQHGNIRWADKQVQIENRRKNWAIDRYSKEEFEAEMSRRGYVWQQAQTE